jgi:tryptophanyl-tRNA synthetase
MSRINLTDDDLIAKIHHRGHFTDDPLPGIPALLTSRPEDAPRPAMLAALGWRRQAAVCVAGRVRRVQAGDRACLPSPIRARLVDCAAMAADPETFLAAGADRAAALAAPTLADCRVSRSRRWAGMTDLSFIACQHGWYNARD